MISEKQNNTTWSTYIQRPDTLYQSRALRFRDENKQELLELLGFKDYVAILEVGCGPGALCHSLKRWLPNSHITGLDRDANFIEYANNKSKETGIDCNFVCGDATNLQFPDNTFDATTSHTVLEHIDTRKFLREQYRVLKPGGIFTEMDVRIGLKNSPESPINPSAEEKAIRDKFEKAFEESNHTYNIAGYSVDEFQLGTHLTQIGFKSVNIKFLAVYIVPDNDDTDLELAVAMIETDRRVALDSASVAQSLAPQILSTTESKRFYELINARFDKRLEMYRKGEKAWDLYASLTRITRGIK